MTATDELRAMLDERGVPYVSAFTTGGYQHTSWRDGDYREVSAVDFGEGKLMFHGNVTPAQAIAATLGADEYAIEHNVDGSYECPKCGCVVDYDVRGDDERIITMDDYVIPFNFCPKCGAEVVCE